MSWSRCERAKLAPESKKLLNQLLARYVVFDRPPTVFCWVFVAMPSSQPVEAAVVRPLRVCSVVRVELLPTMTCLLTSFFSPSMTFFIFDSRMLTTARSPLLAAFSTALRMMGWVKFEYSNLAVWKGSVTAMLTGSKPLVSSVMLEWSPKMTGCSTRRPPETFTRLPAVSMARKRGWLRNELSISLSRRSCSVVLMTL